jgi:hypothetical protein
VAALLEGRQPAAAADAAAVAGVVGVLPLSDRKGLVEMLRQLSSVVQPDRWVGAVEQHGIGA